MSFWLMTLYICSNRLKIIIYGAQELNKHAKDLSLLTGTFIIFFVIIHHFIIFFTKIIFSLFCCIYVHTLIETNFCCHPRHISEKCGIARSWLMRSRWTVMMTKVSAWQTAHTNGSWRILKVLSSCLEVSGSRRRSCTLLSEMVNSTMSTQADKYEMRRRETKQLVEPHPAWQRTALETQRKSVCCDKEQKQKVNSDTTLCVMLML